eukprot:TRINITY_DN10481_c0_g2_i1.p1 TRINITY_DN10481_c0_g2~~TRINITY_DN10481_c0_g2_i1.p1  ORF type:complete len:564 (+),score=141.80 TRINITY_DN10481_c0_g2_i1:30-1721(+)
MDALKDIFPQVPEELLKQVVDASGGSMEKAITLLMQLFGQDEDAEEDEASDENGRSLMRPRQEYTSSCGYCGGRTGVSFGADAEELTVKDYQDLIDRGWRRSGKWMYKPNLKRTCCPQYTIRLNADKFVPSRNHKRVLKHTEKFLQTGEKKQEIKEEDMEIDECKPEKEKKEKPTKAEPTKTASTKTTPDDPAQATLKSAVIKAIEHAKESGKFSEKYSENIMEPCESLDKLVQVKKNFSHQGQYFSTAAVLIVARNKQRHAKTTPASSFSLVPLEVAQLIASELQLPNYEVSVGENGMINFVSKEPATQTQEHEDLVTAQGHQGKKRQKKASKQETTSPAHKLEITLAPSEFTKEEYEIYKKYQIAVHKDEPHEVTEKGYTRFLCNSPLTSVPPTEDQAKQNFPGYGSFHQQYRLDGKLIAVEVIDVLPSCVSSVYFFYDPVDNFLSLGVYSALKDIEWLKKLSKIAPQLRYYYLGFYIHSCQKMRYKAQYKPSELACPETWEWVLLDECVPKLEASKYSRLSNTVKKELSDSEKLEIIAKVPIFLQNRILSYLVRCEMQTS